MSKALELADFIYDMFVSNWGMESPVTKDMGTVKAELRRLDAEVKTLRDGLRVYQTQLEKDTNESDLHALMRQGVEIAELKAELAGIIEKNREPIEQCNAYIARIEAENKTLRDALEFVMTAIGEQLTTAFEQAQDALTRSKS